MSVALRSRLGKTCARLASCTWATSFKHKSRTALEESREVTLKWEADGSFPRGLDAPSSLLPQSEGSEEESLWAIQAALAWTFFAVSGGKHCGPQTCTRLNHVSRNA